MHGSPKLSMSVSACGVFIVNTKNTSFIAVQCQRLALLQIVGGDKLIIPFC
ncbi:Uncharacterised protein [Klebsiella pneumoniae]|nr:Uncharacterised protein [Klebsiella pneumoniae]